jgi:DNA-binding MarR family transcriptional regulator
VLRHHSAVGLVDRAEAAGLVRRVADAEDQRVGRVAATPAGDEILHRLTAAHREELARMAPALEGLWAGLDDRQP